ncbi:hypothetical protein JD974_04980 [Chromobacterium haemolyticum]|uniref:Class I SAM-dependent methyltransferase n=1 Tax=Chromobacterium haemolyticum TaxID=394935 RepID=A0ABS3GIH8_9NEIS|nr:hypothetical protein [Chromobacterium haemolyticum]MBK0413753.1 hypothetical protein [Chromobacterium haemolyticum]MBO0414855.1 hypothetical protein [Chromobacterium haemolyticum]MBO0498116.1 hypothetical protein [Chromobacterium haemolyticum]QOD81162.1 hypothetical protein IEZ30_14595 [Chromobacterium haemolyticum]
MKKILNIAAGFVPLCSSDFEIGDCEVVNYDPLFSAESKKILDEECENERVDRGGVLVGYFIAMLKSFNDVSYHKEIYCGAHKKYFDLVVCVSPYGFTLINKDVDEALKDNGTVLVVGNSGNRYIKNKDFFTTDVKKNYIEQKDARRDWVGKFGWKLLTQYRSHTSSLEKGTRLDTMLIYNRNKEG